MSCSSTTCTSSRYYPPGSHRYLSKPFSSGFERLRLVLFAALNGLVCALERRHQHRQLFELDDRLLDDIGISRQWAVESISRSFWIDLNVGRIEQ